MESVSCALRDARKAAGLHQRDLARTLGVSQAFLSLVERGERALPEAYLDKLPPEIREPVILAALNQTLTRARDLRAMLGVP